MPQTLYEQQQDKLLLEGRRVMEEWSNMPVGELAPFKFQESIDGKFINFLDHIPAENKWRRYTVAKLLENARKEYYQLSEAVRTQMIGGFEKFLFPTIAGVYGNLVLDELVSMQPLAAPSGLIFYLDVIAGSTKGSIKKGDKLYTATLGPTSTRHYLDEVVENESIATGSGTITLAGNASYVPVRAGTFTMTDGTLNVTDDGNGGLVGDCISGSVNYATGAVTCTLSGNNSNSWTATYEYDIDRKSVV